MACFLCGDEITMTERAAGGTIMIPDNEPVYRVHTECYNAFVDALDSERDPDRAMAQEIRQLEKRGLL